ARECCPVERPEDPGTVGRAGASDNRILMRAPGGRVAAPPGLRYSFPIPKTQAPRRPRPQRSSAFPTLKSTFLDALRERVLVFDGGMGTQIQARELSPDDFGGKR